MKAAIKKECAQIPNKIILDIRGSITSRYKPYLDHHFECRRNSYKTFIIVIPFRNSK